MKKNLCPVCYRTKDKDWHLVCSGCWETVPENRQSLLWESYKKAPKSEQHAQLCRDIVFKLCQSKRFRSAKDARAAKLRGED